MTGKNEATTIADNDLAEVTGAAVSAKRGLISADFEGSVKIKTFQQVGHEADYDLDGNDW